MLLSSLMVVLLLMVACAPKVSDDQLEKDLSKLSPEEQSALLKQAQDSPSFAGNAVATRYGASDRTQLVRVLTKMKDAQSRNPKQPLESRKADLKVVFADFKMVLNQTNNMQDVEYVANVQNVGAADAGPFAVKFAPQVLTAKVQTNLVPSLPAGMMYTVKGTYSAYNETGAPCKGSHNLNITADYLNKVAESDEMNNGYVLMVTC